MMSKMHVKTGDTVVLLTGRDKTKSGKILEVSPNEGKVIVEGVNVIKKHVKPTRMGQSGGIVEAEAPIYACKVQLVCPKCGKATRVGHGFETKTNAAGVEKKLPIRICKKCGHNF